MNGFIAVLQEGQSVIINLISHVTEGKSVSFSLNIVLDVFRNLDPTYLPYDIVCTDRRITYTYSSIARCRFIYTECSTFFNVGNHFDPPQKRPVCNSVYVLEIHHYACMYRNGMSHVAVTVIMCHKWRGYID